jgi:hypothetical protein
MFPAAGTAELEFSTDTLVFYRVPYFHPESIKNSIKHVWTSLGVFDLQHSYFQLPPISYGVPSTYYTGVAEAGIEKEI